MPKGRPKRKSTAADPSANNDVSGYNSKAPDLKEMFSLGPGNPLAGFPSRRWPIKPDDFETSWTLYYDTMANLAAQLLKACAIALELSDEGRVICSACYPYPVLYANKAWSKLTKYQQHEISGKSLSLLQGELTDLSAIQVMMHNVQYTGHGKAEVINYRQDGTPFFCSLQIQPISSSDMYGELKITHLLGTYNIFDIETNIDKIKSLNSKLDEDYSWLIKCDIDPNDSVSNKRKRQPSSFSLLEF
jgi:hypothetical protein